MEVQDGGNGGGTQEPKAGPSKRQVPVAQLVPGPSRQQPRLPVIGRPLPVEGLVHRFDVSQGFDRQLPEEVLEKICRYLYLPQHVQSMSQTCRTFERILAPDKVYWMFDQALPILFSYLEKADVLNSRFTCRMWSHAVPNLLDNHPSTLPYNRALPADSLLLSPSLKERDFEFKSLYEIRRGDLDTPTSLLAKFHAKNYRGNLLLTRSLNSMSDLYYPRSTYWKQFLELLRHHGTHIYHLQLKWCEPGMSEQDEDFYKVVRRCLSLVPNLRSLRFDLAMRMVPGFSRPAKEKDARRVKNYVVTHPLPEIPSLTTIFFDFSLKAVGRPQQAVMDELFRKYKKQLKWIKMDSSVVFLNPGFAQYFTGMENLCELHLVSFFQEKMENGPCSVERFLTAAPAFPQLGKVSLTIRQLAVHPNIPRIIGILQKFPGLESLVFDFFQSPEFPVKEQNVVETLPKLKNLEVCVCILGQPLRPFYDLLLRHLPFLRFLEVKQATISTQDDETFNGGEYDKNFQIYKGLRTGQMLKAAIWRKMPTLKAIRCQDGYSFDKILYTRDQYEAAQEM